MHKSKLAGFIIDCQTDNLNSAAEFWGHALGMQLSPLPEAEGETYVQLIDPLQQLHIEVQSVKHPSRVHLDIETDDIDAEAQRLIQHGATIVKRVHSWIVMEAPTGQRFCIVKTQSKAFDQQANIWA